jgi:hypothetical protein
MEAVASRLPMYAFVYADRVEIRSAKPGATPIASVVAPTTSDPILRLIKAKPQTTIFDVTNAIATPSATLTTTTGKQVVFDTLGAGFIGPTAPAAATPVYLYINNAAAPATSLWRRFRIDIAGLTGFVQLNNTW